jgi:hypothetical protein
VQAALQLREYPADMRQNTLLHVGGASVASFPNSVHGSICGAAAIVLGSDTYVALIFEPELQNRQHFALQ